MAVYKRGYQRYAGPLTGRWTRFMVLPRYAWERLYQQRLVILLTMLAFLWPLLCAGFVYLTNHVELLQGLEPEFREFIQVDGRFFAIFMYVQAGFAIFLAALAGPGLIAPDLANNALPLYLSRPLTRWKYALARLIVIVGMLSVVTWIPGLLLFGLQVGLAGGWWFLANWTLGAGMVVGFLLWLLVLSLVAMASSAYVKWRVVAGAVSLAFFFLLTGVAEMIDEVFRVTWGHALDPAWAVNRVWCSLLGVDPPAGPDAGDFVAVAGGIRLRTRPGDRTQAAAGGGGPMTEPASAEGYGGQAAAPKLGRRASEGGAVVFEDVSKFYGEVLGVNRVTLNIPPGITSLVGPNGSGKTTLMNLMTGLLFPDHGSILMRGISPRNPEALMRITGYATQYDTAPRWATGFTFITTGLLLFGYGRTEAEERAWKALERVSLTEAANRKVAAYSKGMRQRVRLAQAIAHDPDVVVLDEPLNGLDPLVRAETIDLFRSWAVEGKHVILSSHVLQEVDVISDQVVLIANGMIVAEGKIRNVRDEIDEHPSQYIVRCRDGDASGVAALLFGEDHITEIKLNDDRMGMLVMTRDREQFARALGRIALDGHRIESVVPADENVDALYQYLIGGKS